MVFNEVSDEFYRSIIEHNPDAIFVLSLDGEIMKINNMVTKIFGYTQKEVEDTYFQDLTIPKYKEEFYYHLSQALHGIPYENEFDAYHENGESLHLQVKSIPLITQNKIVGIFCVVKDLSELQRIKRMEQRFKAVFNSSADAIDILDLDGNIIDVNPGFEKLYGWKREEVIGKPLPIIPKCQLAVSTSLMERVKMGEKIKGLQVAGIRKDGSQIEVSLTYSPIRDTNGNIVALSGIIRDVTEQKKLEKSLKESEERYRLLAGNSLDLIQLVDLDGIVTYASPSHKSVLGYEPKEYIGQWIFYQPDTGIDETFKETFLTMASTHQSFTCEIVRNHKNGQKVWLELKGTPMFDKERNFKYMMIAGREITERKKLRKTLGIFKLP